MSDAPLADGINCNATGRPDTIRALGWLLSVWGISAAAGVIAVSMPSALGAAHPVSFTRSVFTCVNAATGSGFSQQFAKTEDFSPFVQWVLSFETMGGILLSLIAGGLVLNAVLRLEIAFGKILGMAAIMIGLAALAGVMSRTSDSFSESMDRGICALGGAGPAQQLTGWTPLTEKLVLTPLALLGSVGVLAIVMLRRRGPAAATFTQHLRRVISVAAAVYLIGFILNVFQLLSTGPAIENFFSGEVSIRPVIQAGSAITLAARGWGVPVDLASAWPRGVAWSVMAISVVGVGTLGAMPGLSIAWLMTFPRRFWRTILTLLAAQAAAALTVLLILLNTEPQLSAERILMLVVSASAKTGLSHEAVSITGSGLFALAALMIVSKILPLFLLLAATTQPLATDGRYTAKDCG